jgi:hypothetical protein
MHEIGYRIRSRAGETAGVFTVLDVFWLSEYLSREWLD